MIEERLILESKLRFLNIPFVVKGRKIILDPNELSIIVKWSEWQETLKEVAQINQDFKCVCGKYLPNGELHHALISRQQVMRMKNFWMIHHSYNVILCHPRCHGKLTREKSLEYLLSIYGEEVMDWIKNFPSNSHIRLNK